ncbi:uncharacterized protein LOC131150538 [Malania oleifera]|uniref:uncharacterized protein LOC131150538 n=1 Tax=Malania oleifera TaxID=397392 RepID=UPI0025ADA818|nr:uncharacterized protein LOC131150538 [Malania oleifera]
MPGMNLLAPQYPAALTAEAPSPGARRPATSAAQRLAAGEEEHPAPEAAVSVGQGIQAPAKYPAAAELEYPTPDAEVSAVRETPAPVPSPARMAEDQMLSPPVRWDQTPAKRGIPVPPAERRVRIREQRGTPSLIQMGHGRLAVAPRRGRRGSGFAGGHGCCLYRLGDEKKGEDLLMRWDENAEMPDIVAAGIDLKVKLGIAEKVVVKW